MIPIVNVKEKLIERVKELSDEIAARLFQEWDDILLQLKLETDPETLKAYKEAKTGKNLIPHSEVIKHLKDDSMA